MIGAGSTRTTTEPELVETEGEELCWLVGPCTLSSLDAAAVACAAAAIRSGGSSGARILRRAFPISSLWRFVEVALGPTNSAQRRV